MQTVSSPKDFHRKYCIWCAPLHAHCTLNRIHNIVRDIKCTLCCRTMYILYRIWNMYIVQNKGNKVSAYRERQTVYELLNRFAFNRILMEGGGDIWRKHVIFHKNMSYILVFSKVNIIFRFICHLFIKGETNSRISIKIVECSINCSIKNRQFQLNTKICTEYSNNYIVMHASDNIDRIQFFYLYFQNFQFKAY